jgi:selenide,water dikinase
LPARAYYRDEVVGIDRATRQVLCRNRPPVPYDAALDQHRLDAAAGPGGGRRRARGAGQADPPLQRTLAGPAGARAQHPGATTIALVGAGAGGVELTLAMQYRLRNELLALGRDPDDLMFHLFSPGRESCPRTTPGCAGI